GRCALERKRSVSGRLSFAVALVWLGYLLAPAQAALTEEKFKALRTEAEQAEKLFQWDKACEAYEAILKYDRNRPGIKARYQHCLRRFYQIRRHDDATFQKEVLGLPYAQALKVYPIVLESLLTHSVEKGDKKKVEPGRLFRHGIE